MTYPELLQHLGIDYREQGQDHHATEGRINVICPFCVDSSSYTLGIHLRDGRTNCWKCGHHSLPDSLMSISGLSYREIKVLLNDTDNGIVRKQVEKRTNGQLKLPSGLMPLGTTHRRYLEKRGFDPSELENLWGIKGIGLASRLPWRIWIPITNKGKLVSWTTRSLSNSGLRYISAKKTEELIPHKEILFGGDKVKGHQIIVCEGPLDVMALGFGAVGTCGIGYSKFQLLEMSRYPYRYVCFDSDLDGQRRARELCQRLEAFGGKTINIELETGKDPASASKKEIREIRKRFLR